MLGMFMYSWDTMLYQLRQYVVHGEGTSLKGHKEGDMMED